MLRIGGAAVLFRGAHRKRWVSIVKNIFVDGRELFFYSKSPTL
jgi:hypothetical protein